MTLQWQSDEWVVGALLAMTERQTADEQAMKGTAHLNGIGFNSADAPILTDIAQFYGKTGRLSPAQLNLVRRLLKKYEKQLLECWITPRPIGAKAAFQETKTADLKGETLVISFRLRDRSDFRSMVEAMKVHPFRARFDGKTKTWVCPVEVRKAEALKEMGFTLSNALTEWLGTATEEIEEVTVGNIPGFRGELYSFQRETVAYLEARNGRGLVGDEMGLGKTAQAIAWVLLNQAFPAIIVCPASLKLNWRSEIRKFADAEYHDIHICQGRKPHDAGDKQWIIINYDILAYWVDHLAGMKPQTIIMDEVHYTKNAKAKRTKATRMLAKKAPHVIGLTGTPIVSRPVEFFTILNLLRKDVFGSFWTYARRFCNARHNGFGWDFTGASNTEELHEMASEYCMIRHLKKDVLKDLPPKQRSMVPIEIDMDRYAVAYDEEMDPLPWITSLKRKVAELKLEGALSWIEDFLESGEKLVVFAHHHTVLDALEEKFGKVSVRVDGRITQEDRHEAVQRFQGDSDVRLFIGQTQAAGTGLTLTAASNVAFLEFEWTPGEHDQAEDRVHRIGQEADSITAYYLIADGTIENDIVELLDKKRTVLAQVLDGASAEEELSIFQDLMERVRGDA